MYFKSIEMQGFKSFADRTIVNLESGMTAVVGPNGCGKSNILDALRWALGEQSAKALRGSHMQDVIFNGSEDRAPTGLAEVTLTFDNADNALPVDFAEVQITRRVYRSGESEYLINKAPCRLRDVQELFMDTGVGTNAYSMIGQGKIGLVLSSKPEDRRFLFEEAAGIIKYKNRKRIAMRKLDQAEQNLLRLHDIVMEVERQMRSLKRQVNAAIRHRELTAELKELEIRAAWLQHTSLTSTIESLRGQFSEAQNHFESDSAELSTLEARFEELNLAKLEVDRALHTRRESVHQIDSEMEKIERQIALIRQQIDFSHTQEERAAEEHAQLLVLDADLRARQTQAQERAEELQRQVDQGQAALESKQAEFNEAAGRVADADGALEMARASAVESMGLRAKAHTAIETLSVSIANVESQLDAIYQRQSVDTQRSDELLKSLDEHRQRETERQDAFARLEVQQAAAMEEDRSLSATLTALNEQWQNLRERKSSTEARLNSLRELRDSYEGFAAGVRAIMAARQNSLPQARGVIGPVGDLLATDNTFERAIEAALGGNINNIIVDDADAAKGAIAFLKDTKAGRVTFLPLDTIRAGQRDDIDRLAGARGVVGPALDFVRYDAHLHTAMAFLFHNTVIVENIDDAIAIARKHDRFPRLVTLEGEVVASSGAVTGGRTKHDKGGLLGRSAEIAELEEKLASTEHELRAVAAQGQELTAKIQSIRQSREELARDEAQLRKELNEIRLTLARTTTEIDSLIQAAAVLERDRDALSAKRATLEHERREASERALSMESEEEALQRRIAEAQDAAAHARHAHSLLAGELSDLRLSVASVKQTLEEIERDRQRFERERDQARVEAQRRVDAMDQLKKNQSQLETDTSDYIQRSKALSETREDARKLVVDAENQRQALLDESDGLEKQLKALRDRSRESQSRVHKLELALRHDEDQLHFFQQRILTEYNIALAALSDEQVGRDEYDDETRDKLVKETRAKIERMGSVNLMAIEEYDALTQRYNFLVTQEEDLRKAREALLNVVQRIDGTIKEMFLETFRAVAENFRQYFRRLFNGGHAQIYLLDEDDPLECGIEVEARPPGKKPQTISLLSGGEQAMTAIALLFSIFKAKPSPFCVLDEVDAPLDDANIGRFLTLLEEFKEQSQFVVITHNKQTMARAGALYGVTQQERGVSQLVSVRFDGVRQAEPAA